MNYSVYNINEARSGQIRWADAIFTNEKIRQKLITTLGEGQE